MPLKYLGDLVFVAINKHPLCLGAFVALNNHFEEMRSKSYRRCGIKAHSVCGQRSKTWPPGERRRMGL
jgi:hypothetical protein